jgi:alanyl-tRNA synthetase
VTKRLYYDQPDLLEFDSLVEAAQSPNDPGSSATRPSIVLRETAFYPTSGGQVHDTGWITLASGEKLRVAEVAESEDGRIVHYFDSPVQPPMHDVRMVHGSIDPDRRRDHMQQHTGQHVLSAAFIELYQFPTVSFHMGEDYCSIDLATPTLTPVQVVGAEKRANEIVFENRPVHIRYVHRDEAEKLGLRKLPPAEREELRLIEIADIDLSACGGTHVSATGRIGSILLRKVEKTRQGTRVEFVCGDRAVRVARRDYTTLTEAAGLYSAQLSDVPEMIRKCFEESRTLRRQKDDALEQLAEAMAREAVGWSDHASGVPSPASATAAPRIVNRVFVDRDSSFAKLFAQKATRMGVPVVALVGSSIDPPGLVFAQTPGGSADMGALLKDLLASVGGRGGGSRDFAQGGVPPGSNVQQLLRQAAATIGS